MDKIDNGIVFSDDIGRIIAGRNAFDYNYNIDLDGSLIKSLRDNFRDDVNIIFNGNVRIISEEEMMDIYRFIDGGYPHCIFR